MLVILEATAGPIVGKKIEVRAGSILRLGRTAKSDYVIGDDSYLSSLHFAVECDGSQCRIRDLGSSNGTFVNGNQVTEIIVTDGDSVVAGGSTFLVHFEAAAAPTLIAARAATAAYPFPDPGTRIRAIPVPASAPAFQWNGFSPSQCLLLSALFRETENVFAVVDSSRDARIPAFLEASGERFVPLDDSASRPAYAVSLPRQSRLLDVLVKDGWGRGWGFYCEADGSLDEVCAHWRNFVRLRADDGKRLTFRFWDPRVLRALAPLMPAMEIADFFGPLRRIIVEGERPEIALELSPGPRGAEQQTLVLL